MQKGLPLSLEVCLIPSLIQLFHKMLDSFNYRVLKSRNVIYTAGFMLVLIGFVPKIGAFTTIIPSSVLGGAMVAMFGMVVASGIKMLSKVEFNSENLLIIACSVGLGLGVTVVPDIFANVPDALKVITGSGIVAGSLSAIILKYCF